MTETIDPPLGDGIAIVHEAPEVHEPQPKPAPAQRHSPKWELDVRERIRTAIRRFTKPLADLAERDANEGDTRLFVTDFLCEALGYDKFSDLTTEYLVRGEFADYGIRIDKQLVAFIEVKRIATKLDAKHLRQVEMYAVNEGVEWVILTNGATWRVYHLTGGLPVVIDLVIDVDLLGDATLAHKTNGMFYLSRESLKRQQILDVWRARSATAPKSLAQVVLAEPVIAVIQRELRRRTGQNITTDELTEKLRQTVLRPEAL